MTILVAPLNWGLGHASRCVPLIQRLLDEGNEVVLGGDGESLTLLRKHFPKLRYVYLAPLNIRYGKGKRQVWAILKALPQLIAWTIKDHALLKAVLQEEHFDQIISDNRFGLYLSPNPQTSNPLTVYITHQLHIILPKGWRWLEPLVARIHARVYARFNKVWVPDYSDYQQSLAGDLSHPQISNSKYQVTTIEYIGPLSRFTPNPLNANPLTQYDTVAVLSGLEPQRTMLEHELIARYSTSEERVLIVQGLMNRPNTRITRTNMTIVPYLSDTELAAVLKGAKHIIARSGYSTIMDLNALGLRSSNPLNSNPLIELLPTPGQPEQEYLAKWIAQKALF